MRISRIKYPNITVIFKKKNGETWKEQYSSYAIEIFKRNPEVYEIRYTESDKLIYSREN